MGDIADAILDGEICEGCQCNLPGLAPGYPRRCNARDCKLLPQHDDLGVAQRKHPGRNERARAKSAKGDPLPQWALDAIAGGDPIVLRYHCAYCPSRHFRLHAAAVDHLRDVHGVTSGITS